MTKRVLVAWSGGKDSAWALHSLRATPDVEVAGLFTTMDEGASRIAVHRVRRELLERQAAAAGLPLVTVALASPSTNAQYEAALARLAEESAARGITHFAFGDLFLEDIRRYRERQFAASRIQLLFPLWGRDTAALAAEMTRAGLKAWVVCVDTPRAPGAWAGACYDESFVARIPDGVDPCGENGEFHTFVFAGPMLSSAIPCRPTATRVEGRFQYADLEPA